MIERVTHQSWFSRIKSAVFGIFFGLLFVVGAIVLQFWNEGRTLHQRQLLEAGKAGKPGAYNCNARTLVLL